MRGNDETGLKQYRKVTYSLTERIYYAGTYPLPEATPLQNYKSQQVIVEQWSMYTTQGPWFDV